ncbi:MAG: hypothetical protein HC862_27115 [Scytonema sp. RU_4_4]|nr:hypothetical protein [Scytonema sp. RU_4_4]
MELPKPPLQLLLFSLGMLVETIRRFTEIVSSLTKKSSIYTVKISSDFCSECFKRVLSSEYRKRYGQLPQAQNIPVSLKEGAVLTVQPCRRHRALELGEETPKAHCLNERLPQDSALSLWLLALVISKNGKKQECLTKNKCEI